VEERKGNGASVRVGVELGAAKGVETTNAALAMMAEEVLLDVLLASVVPWTFRVFVVNRRCYSWSLSSI
jgi:hypothetical protein